ncbi:hypothetical protein MCOR27_002583 [Pyricularia oryzae]|nr:hypothetical protein MCOR01_009366 [Pyricularia oryzae]KAI6284821.1 hypothetical protein MCOR27_002583 [Pyricularia oryzae]KAI6306016.1 hypothetical protein MCOR34_008261 [Pyricularia oryzae]KAI6320002.1 hypothetical protein MCOR30_008420 [Pyricularia oryzae]KAI6358576.1 hypothetical protein MCOR32_009504 [Pyricularia oryzae]
MPSAGGDRMRTRSQAQGSDKRSADELEAAPPNSTKRLRAYHGYRQVLQPIGIKEETKDDIRVKSESASPVPLFSRNNQVLTRRDSNVWDEGMHLPPSPPYLATTNQSSSPGGRTASRLTAKLRSRRARTDIGIVPKIESGTAAGQENGINAPEVPSDQSSAQAPTLALLRQEERKRKENLRLLRQEIARHYPFTGPLNHGDVSESEAESERGNSSGDADAGSDSNRTTSSREDSSDDEDSEDVADDGRDSLSDSDDPDSDENENIPLIHVRRRLVRTTFMVSSPVPKKEDGDTTESEVEDENDTFPLARNHADRVMIKTSSSSSSMASSSAACSACGDREGSEDDDPDSYASDTPTDVESNIAIYNDEDAHTRLNQMLRQAPVPCPTGVHHIAVDQSVQHGMRLRSPAQIMQRLRQDDDDSAAHSGRLQSSSPPRADYDEYRLRARYLEQFKDMTAAQLDEAGRDLDYRARKLNSKRSAYELALHERAFPRY